MLLSKQFERELLHSDITCHARRKNRRKFYMDFAKYLRNKHAYPNFLFENQEEASDQIMEKNSIIYHISIISVF